MSGVPATGGPRVLIAEDESLIRLDLAELLGEEVIGQTQVNSGHSNRIS